MKKEELIKKYEAIFEKLYVFPVIAIGEVLEDLKQLDEPQEVVVPQFVADHLKKSKEVGRDLQDAINSSTILEEVDLWLYTDNNMDVFARAWLDGYTVEEKRYLVKVMNIYSSSSMLKRDDITGEWFFGSEAQMFASSMIHTRKELEEAGFGWVFDCLGIELEEVEG